MRDEAFPRETERRSGGSAANVPYLVKVIRDALEQHARPGHNIGCSICQGALAALNQLVPEEADDGRT